MSTSSLKADREIEAIEEAAKQIAVLKARVSELEAIVADAMSARQAAPAHHSKVIPFPADAALDKHLERPAPGSTADILRLPNAMRSLLCQPQRRKKANADDFTLIKGLDGTAANVLRQLGHVHFADIAALTPAEVTRVIDQLDDKAALSRTSWIEQAQILATGRLTAYARKVMQQQTTIDADAIALHDAFEAETEETPVPRRIEIRTEPLDPALISPIPFYQSDCSNAGRKRIANALVRPPKRDWGNLKAMMVSLLSTAGIAAWSGLDPAVAVSVLPSLLSGEGAASLLTLHDIERIVLEFTTLPVRL